MSAEKAGKAVREHGHFLAVSPLVPAELWASSPNLGGTFSVCKMKTVTALDHKTVRIKTSTQCKKLEESSFDHKLVWILSYSTFFFYKEEKRGQSLPKDVTNTDYINLDY